MINRPPSRKLRPPPQPKALRPPATHSIVNLFLSFREGKAKTRLINFNDLTNQIVTDLQTNYNNQYQPVSKEKTVHPHLEAQLKQITNRIVEAFSPPQVILFGSHVYGHPTPDSDVDLLIIMDSDERPAARATRVSRLALNSEL